MSSPEVYDPAIVTAPITHEPSRFAIGTALKFWALGDRVLVREDEFRTGYECTTCSGKKVVPCGNCEGKGVNITEDPLSTGPLLRVEKKCSACDGTGKVTCVDCRGVGALIVAPETSERRPSSGTVVSAGQRCAYLREGDSVLYSNFAGYVVDLNDGDSKVCMRILHESEILAGMEGHLTLTNLKGKSEIAQFGN